MPVAGDKDENFIIANKTKGRLPRLPFVDIKNSVLGKNYELSVVFSGHGLSRKLNSIYRAKNKPTNVLAFPLSKKTGEIVIDLAQAKKEHELFGKTFTKFVGYLLIHGMLHLNGMAHGGRMEAEEQKILENSDYSYALNFSYALFNILRSVKYLNFKSSKKVEHYNK